MIFLAEYLHRLNPVLLRLTDSIQLRWYGIAYVMGFIAGYWLLVRWARKGVGELKESEVADFITYAALFGVLLGGRLGYMLLYTRDDFFAHPLSFFQITNGGMASHGGIAGLFFFTLYFALKHKRSWPGLGDNLVCAAPLGLFFGRIANFINGELYGRAASVPWAMKFPEEATRWYPDALDPEIASKAEAVRVLALQNGANPESWHQQIMSLSRTSDAFAEGLRPLLTARHPSQLYAAALLPVFLYLRQPALGIASVTVLAVASMVAAEEIVSVAGLSAAGGLAIAAANAQATTAAAQAAKTAALQPGGLSDEEAWLPVSPPASARASTSSCSTSRDSRSRSLTRATCQ